MSIILDSLSCGLLPIPCCAAKNTPETGQVCIVALASALQRRRRRTRTRTPVAHDRIGFDELIPSLDERGQSFELGRRRR
jgi:hypothetical protein